jgi:hypothetical protein
MSSMRMTIYVEEMGRNLLAQFNDAVRTFMCFSIALDDSTRAGGAAQPLGQAQS